MEAGSELMGILSRENDRRKGEKSPRLLSSAREKKKGGEEEGKYGRLGAQVRRRHCHHRSVSKVRRPVSLGRRKEGGGKGPDDRPHFKRPFPEGERRGGEGRKNQQKTFYLRWPKPRERKKKGEEKTRTVA